MTWKTCRRALGAALTGCCVAGASDAQDLGFLNWTPGNFAVTEGRVGLGVGSAPEYLGSNDMVATPLPSFAFTVGRLPIQNNGMGIEVNVRPGFRAPPSGTMIVAYGPILRYDSGRNDGTTVSNPVIAKTTPVPAAAELGGFIEATLPVGPEASPTLITARVSVVESLSNSREGALAEASLGFVKPLGAWTVGAGVAGAVASDAYTNAFFGVSATDAAATGLSPYSATGGLLNVGVSLFASYAVSDHWSVDLLAGYTVLTEDAADSPIVVEEGSADQPFAGLGLTYRF